MALTYNNSLILLYHRFGSPFVFSKVQGQYVMPFCLNGQVKALRSEGYKSCTLHEMVSYPENKTGHFAPTFDDSYLSVGTRALPVLQKYGVTGTLFVVASAIGKTNLWDQRIGDRTEALLDRVQLKELAASGFEIASHTLTHPWLTKLSDSELKAEVQDSKHQLEDLFGFPIVGFSYPYGDYDERVREAAIEAGYEYAVSTDIGVMKPDTDLFSLPRINIRWNTYGSRFSKKIQRAFHASGLEQL